MAKVEVARTYLINDFRAAFGALRRTVSSGFSPGRYARLQEKLEEMEGELVREALTAWLGFAGFCTQEMGLEAEKLVEVVARPFAERVRELEELSARHEVEADAQGVEEYLVMMTEAWRRGLESA